MITQPAGWQAFQRFEHDGWNEVAAVYAELVDAFGLTTGPAGEAILDATGISRGDRVVDIATGPGFLAGLAAARGANVVGVDLSEAMVDEARRRYPDVTFQQGAAESLPLPDASCDAVVSAWGLPHFAEHHLAFAEARRVLRPGGALAMATWAPPPGNQFFALLSDAVTSNIAVPPSLPAGPDFFRYADPDVARADLDAAGFTSVEHRRIDFRVCPPNGAQDVVRFLRAGSVRTRATYLAQPGPTRGRIEAALSRAFEAADTSRAGLQLQAVILSAR